MVNFTWVAENFGSVDLFYLPYFRERIFLGRKRKMSLEVCVLTTLNDL
ncbi:MAG: hypothetical protein M2R45_05322 [Verrucomicrobia subdivision 3 bacterium]|nr:hypothetical protein [Limisphaerales bacterium]MCS1415718.1 hypothetical protein [Limisphaerales bacterium]